MTVPIDDEPHLSIVIPDVEANNFKLKPFLLSMVQQNQLLSLPTKYPNLYLSILFEFHNTLKMNGVSPIKFLTNNFPFFLRDRARAWLQSLPSNSIMTWNKLKVAFLTQYFPPSKTT